MRTFATPSRKRTSPWAQDSRRGLPAVSPAHASTFQRTAIRHILHGASRLQAKLLVGASDNVCEREADRVADAVMRLPAHDEGIQRMCSECKEEHAAPRSPSGKAPRVGDGVEAKIQALRGGGRPLPDAMRSFFEPRFGESFAGVRIHDDSRAQTLARAVSARAFTVGRDIVFGAGQYAPQSAGGRQLLGHELTHVVQQGSAESQFLQRAETDTSLGCPKTDTKGDVNTKVNGVLKSGRAKAGKSPVIKAIVQEIWDKLAKNTSLGRTAVENWAATLGSSKVSQPAKASTKFAGVTYGLWSQTAFPILNPSMKVAGICIGSDKLGHFFQQGLDYFKIAVAQKKGQAAAEREGETTESGGFGLSTTGVFSNADLEANRQGLKFYKDLVAKPSLTFDISTYINANWNEETNPSFYESSVAEQVWANLLSGQWKGFFSGGGAKTSIDVDLKATTGGKVSGSYTYQTSKGKSVAGKITNGKIQFQTKSVRATSLFGGATTKSPVRGVEIEFDWSQSGSSGKGKWTSTDEDSLKGTWGTGKSATSGGPWNIDRV